MKRQQTTGQLKRSESMVMSIDEGQSRAWFQGRRSVTSLGNTPYCAVCKPTDGCLSFSVHILPKFILERGQLQLTVSIFFLTLRLSPLAWPLGGRRICTKITLVPLPLANPDPDIGSPGRREMKTGGTTEPLCSIILDAPPFVRNSIRFPAGIRSSAAHFPPSPVF